MQTLPHSTRRGVGVSLCAASNKRRRAPLKTTRVPPTDRYCLGCGKPFIPWHTRHARYGWVLCCSDRCRFTYLGRQARANGSLAKACAVRRREAAARAAERLKGLATMKEAYQLGFRRGYRRGLDVRRAGVKIA